VDGLDNIRDWKPLQECMLASRERNQWRELMHTASMVPGRQF